MSKPLSANVINTDIFCQTEPPGAAGAVYASWRISDGMSHFFPACLPVWLGRTSQPERDGKKKMKEERKREEEEGKKVNKRWKNKTKQQHVDQPVRSEGIMAILTFVQ